jgi:CheY-like chemotaxis protein
VVVSITSGPLPPTLGDPERLQQVVWNLLTNGVKFTERGGKVALDARHEGGEIVVRVTDTGQGIDPAFLPHVFEPFCQADASTTRRAGGLGLGLAIVKHIVQAHGGSIKAASAGPGKGASFTVRLPVRAPPAVVASEGSRDDEAKEVHLDGLRVLVVDDEEEAHTLLQRVLEERGAQVAVATSSEQALVTLQKCRPDVIVSDIAMPGMVGYSLMQSVRTLPPERGGKTPAIALTAYAGAEDSQRAFSAGFQRHLPKPVDLGKLVTLIANLGGA